MKDKSKNWYRRIFSVLLAVSMLLPGQAMQMTAMAGAAKEADVQRLQPQDLTFRKVFSNRNLFDSELLIDQMDFRGIQEDSEEKLKLENKTSETVSNRWKLGEHVPYSTYDLEVTKQGIGSSVGLELYKDENNRILLSQNKPKSDGDLSFDRFLSRVAMDDVNGLTIYQDIGDSAVTATENGLKFEGVSSARGESFVQIGKAGQGKVYQVTVDNQGSSYGNAIMKLRKDNKNGIFLVTNAAGALSYEVFKNGSSVTGSKLITQEAAQKPYTMQIEIAGKNLIFSRYAEGKLQASQMVDVSAQFDLSNPDVIQEFEAVFGYRGAVREYVEYSDASMYEHREEKYELDLDGDLTKYDDIGENNLERTENGLKFSGNSSAKGENFVSLGEAQQGLSYEAVVSGQSSSYGNAILKLRKRTDPKTGIFFLTSADGALKYDVILDGKSVENKTIQNEGVDKPYTLQLAVRGKELLLSRTCSGSSQESYPLDISKYFDLEDPGILREFEVVFGGRTGLDEFVEYSGAGVEKSRAGLSEDYSELKLEVYAGGQKTEEMILDQGETELPFTIRADFAAESIGNNVKKGFLSVWKVKEGNATLLKNNIELKGIDFSDPEIVKQYPAYLRCDLEDGAEVEISDFHHYFTGGAAQADPKPLHDETGALLQEGNTVWLAMTVRGYDIHSSYQGVYSFDIKTGELKLVSVLAFNLDGRGHFAPYHAADIIYNRMAGEWIVMPTAHNESPHSVKSGLIPEDPRTTPFQFVDVTSVNYPNQSNEEDASLIYDQEAGKWRLVMCDSGAGGYQLPLYEADTWDGEYREIARYDQAPCTGIQLQKLDGQYYVFFGRNTDNCEALRYPEMDNPVKLDIQSSPRSYNVWPVIIPFNDAEAGITRYFMLSFDRETHGGAHSYGNIYLYEAEQYPGRPKEEEKAEPSEAGVLSNGEITNAKELEQIRNDLDGDYILKNHIDLSGAENWVPIGDKEHPFTGTLNGNGYAITGLQVKRPNTDRAGLFGQTGAGAVVKNITISQAAAEGRNYVGLLSGYNAGIIQNCRVYGDVEAFSTGGILAGQNTGRIEFSSAGGTIRGTGGDSIGGFVGNNSANIGEINLSEKGIIQNSYSLSDVQGGMNTGGFAGYNDCGTITNSYAKGTVQGIANVGGLIGNNGRSYGNSSKVPVSFCYADTRVRGQRNTGALAGHNDGKLEQVFAVGSAEGTINTGGLIGSNNTKGELRFSYTSATAAGAGLTGGLIGFNRGKTEKSAHTELTEGIGNSLNSVWESEAPDLQAAETFSEGGPLSGFTASAWNTEAGDSPELLNVKKPEQLYLVLSNEVDGAKAEADQGCAAEGTLVTLRVDVSKWAELEKISVTDVKLTKVDDKTYTFKMPGRNVTVTPTLRSMEKRQLRDLIQKMNQLEEKQYTPNSWAVFGQLLDEGKAVYEADGSTEDDCIKAYQNIEKAYQETLLLRADKTVLTSYIREYEKLYQEAYFTSASWKKYKTELDEAKKIETDDNASGTSVVEAQLNLTRAVNDLVHKGNKKVLEAVLNMARNADTKGCIPSSAERLNRSIAKAAELMKNEDASGDMIEEMCRELSDAVRELKKDPNMETAQAVMNQINAIGRVTVQSKSAIEAAEKAFAALSPEQKKLVTNQAYLELARKTYQELTKLPEKNSKYNIGSYQYKVTKSSAKSGTVSLVKPRSKKMKKAVIPAYVVIKNYRFQVTSIEGKAFCRNKKLKTIAIQSEKLKKIGRDAFKGIAKKAVIKVPKKCLGAYKKRLRSSGLAKTIKIAAFSTFQ